MKNVYKDPTAYANEIINEFNGDAPAALAAYIESMQGAWRPLSYMTAVRDLLADACSN